MSDTGQMNEDEGDQMKDGDNDAGHLEGLTHHDGTALKVNAEHHRQVGAQQELKAQQEGGNGVGDQEG